MPTLQSYLERLCSDDRGAVNSVEALTIGTLAVVGLMAGVAALRDGVVSELSDVSRSVQSLTQSYRYNSIGSTSAGSDFVDRNDGEEIFGAPNNCIMYDVLPTDELKAVVSNISQVLDFQFANGATDSSPFGSDNSGTLQNGASVSNGTLFLDGQNDRVAISNSNDINLRTVTQRTIFVDFVADDVNRRQIIFEEGGGIRGLNIYLHNGMLYLGSYNLAETSYQTFLSTPVAAGERITATLRLDANNSVQPNAFTGFLNGVEFGSGDAAQVNRHSGAIRLGGISGNTVLHDGVRRSNQGGNTFFGGQINAFQIFNRAVTDDEICALGGHP